jgi:hypothetical protein
METRDYDSRYIAPDQWCDRLGRDNGMLISGLYIWWFDIIAAVKLIANSHIDNLLSPTDDMGSKEVVDLYDLLLEICVPLIAITEAGPSLFESLNESRETASQTRPTGCIFLPISELDSSLSPQELESLKRTVIDEVGYSPELFNALVEIAEIARRYCIECEQLFHSQRGIEEIATILKLRYVEEAEYCVKMKFLTHFPFP